MTSYAPTTNHYRCEDGRHLLVTAHDRDGMVSTPLGRLPVSRSHLPTTVDVFLADADGVVLDADGDPANGMTPIARLTDVDSHEAALTALGYALPLDP
jgi:hypothetical protein